MAALTVGKAIYTQMLNEEGIIIDDIIVFRISDNKYWITTFYVNQMKDIFKQVSVDFDVEYKDVTAEYIMYVVQGSNSRKVMNKIVHKPVDDMEWFSITDNQMDDFVVYVCGAGYTGELGYEIYTEPSHKEVLDKRISEAGKNLILLIFISMLNYLAYQEKKAMFS